ncbi:MAG: hypothetical protein LBD06_10290 [Candidatus Accumulibacter sp.]|nr:hypothetical protein [Accumulibacter sp.]
MSLQRYAPEQGRKTERSGFRGQRFEKTEDRGACGASRRVRNEKPSTRFHPIRREAPQALLSSVFCPLPSILWIVLPGEA